MCEFSAIPNLQQSSVSDKYNKIYSKSLKYPYNTLIIHNIFITTTFALHFQKLLPKKNAKLLQQIKLTKNTFSQALKTLHKPGSCGLQHLEVWEYMAIFSSSALLKKS